MKDSAFHWCRRLVCGVILCLLAVSLRGPGVQAAPPDAVEELRSALLEADGASPEALKARQQTLEKRIKALASISDLRRALALTEWREEVVDAQARAKVGRALGRALEAVCDQGDVHSRLAVANLIGEMGTAKVRAVHRLDANDGLEAPPDPRGYARGLAPLLKKLADDKNLGVRQEALRALSNIIADPEVAVPVLEAALAKDKGGPAKDELGPRRIAAYSLSHLCRVANERRLIPERGVIASLEDVVKASAAAVVASRAGLKDGDADTRVLCVEVASTTGEILGTLIPKPFTRTALPPRKLTPDDLKDPLFKQDDPRRLYETISPLARSLREHVAALLERLHDSDPRARLAALQALENVAYASLTLQRHVAGLPGVQEAHLLESLLQRDKNLVEITRFLADSDVRMRRAALHLLENLEESALPALPALISRLSDPDRFLRLAAARIVAALPPKETTRAVPALARLLADPDLSVRLMAIQTLDNYGALAKDALPALMKAAAENDPEPRIAAMEAMAAIGADQPRACLPTLIEAVEKSTDARVRRTAARVLGRFGPAAVDAVPALRRAIGDEDEEVRVNASDAILSILAPLKQ